jgi:hypothetical protein
MVCLPVQSSQETQRSDVCHVNHAYGVWNGSVSLQEEMSCGLLCSRGGGFALNKSWQGNSLASKTKGHRSDQDGGNWDPVVKSN